MRKMLWVVSGLALVACGDEPRATADLMNASGERVGTATLVEKGDAVELQLEASGLDPGMHGIHFHAVGKCEAPGFTSAGVHLRGRQGACGHAPPEPDDDPLPRRGRVHGLGPLPQPAPQVQA